MENLITVTKTYLPDIRKYKKYIDEIYRAGWVTNHGKLVKKLEEKLKNYLNIDNLLLVSSGTIALQIAYKVLNVKNKAITTPFTFVATVNSLLWEGIEPIFADINEKTFCIEPKEVEKYAKAETDAIVATHVFGNACEIEKLEEISRKKGLKLIFDAAHCFGIKYKGKSILSYGDASTLSFHAIKVFHTIEGGAVVFKSKDDYEKAKLMMNFGFEKLYSISSIGINAKMNEFEAAMGLCILDDIDLILEKRAEIWYCYEKNLKDYVELQQRNKNSGNNYSFFPILFKNRDIMLNIIKELNTNNIYPRRYFYPSLDSLKFIEAKQVMKNSRDISEKILCLPIYFGLEKNIQKKIIEIVRKNL